MEPSLADLNADYVRTGCCNVVVYLPTWLLHQY